MKKHILFFSILVCCLLSGCASKQALIYVGTSSPEGLFAIKLDTKTGELIQAGNQKDVKSPGFLTFSPEKKYLYCVCANNKVRSYKIEKNGQLTFLSEVSSTGKGPCHIEVSKSNKAVVVANYGSGDTSVISVDESGKLISPARHHSHSSFEPPKLSKRQHGPHAHNVVMSPEGGHVFVSDLGLDRILIYAFDENHEKLTPSQPSSIQAPPGSGPRHFTFSPNKRFAYGINELTSTITHFLYEGEGKLSAKKTISTKPEGWTEYNNCADIHVHPNGQFLYGSNRGNNSIAIFRINQNDGSLSLIGHESTRGNWPRNFAISPDGNFLLVANRRSNDVQSFRINQQTGQLSHTGHALSLPAPICLKFF
ncbi:MAG: lactonase family protein [Planctomycetes bacterium]|nr:lactonase family protein [Planctomycetota bacterium]